jgi:hypothetical protein
MRCAATACVIRMNGRMQRGRSLDVSSMRMIDQAAIEDRAFRNFNGCARERAATGACCRSDGRYGPDLLVAA